MQEKKTLNRYLIKFRVIGETGKEFWTDYRVFDVHLKSMKQLLESATYQAQSDASVKLKKNLKLDDISIISFNLIDSE